MSKKIVILVVLVECVFAVLLISFFGQAIYNSNTNVLCQEIYFSYENGDKIEDDAVIEVTLSDSSRSYKLNWVINPSNVTNKSVAFSSSKPNEVIVSEDGIVTFFTDTSVSITIKTMDGSAMTDTIVLVPKRNTSGDVEL